MPVRDLFHDAVRNALVKDGWTITADPLKLEWGGRKTYVDLAAERLLGAEKAGQRIAVEVKSFVGMSELADLEVALGQYVLYRAILERTDQGRRLCLAVPNEVVEGLFREPIGRLVLEGYSIPLIGFDPTSETIIQWTI